MASKFLPVSPKASTANRVHKRGLCQQDDIPVVDRSATCESKATLIRDGVNVPRNLVPVSIDLSLPSLWYPSNRLVRGPTQTWLPLIA